VYRSVALPTDQIALSLDVVADQLPESRLEQPRREVVAIRLLKRSISLVQPIDRQLQGSPRVETRRPWISYTVALGPHCLIEQLWPLGTQEREVTHRAPSLQADWIISELAGKRALLQRSAGLGKPQTLLRAGCRGRGQEGKTFRVLGLQVDWRDRNSKSFEFPNVDVAGCGPDHYPAEPVGRQNTEKILQ
jgi:hypothetical protein